MELKKIERWSLIGHLVSMAFGLAGLLIVLPHADLILQLPPFGQSVFQLSMANGGVLYIVLGTIAVSAYAYRVLGWWQWLSFMVPAIGLSLSSELLGTSTGLPFGDYGYLSGLGYKIAGLVPFTIPLSWFYLGFSCYIVARAGFDNTNLPNWLRHTGAIFFGALLLTSWDFVLDPAMSQTAVPFWEWTIFWDALPKLCWLDGNRCGLYVSSSFALAKGKDFVGSITAQFTNGHVFGQLLVCSGPKYWRQYLDSDVVRHRSRNCAFVCLMVYR
jgi:uncharacterized membrane protein